MDPVQTLWSIIGHKQKEEAYEQRERAYKFQVAKEAYDVEVKELELSSATLKGSMELARGATNKIDKDHYLSVAEGYFKQLPRRQQEKLWPMLANSPLDPQVQKYTEAAEALKQTGHLLPGDLAKKYQAIPPDQVNPLTLAYDTFDEADSKYQLDKKMGLDPQVEVAIPTMTKEIETPTGKKTERMWAVREGFGKQPRMVSETEMNWANIETQRGLDPGHIANHNGNIVTEEPAYINGVYGVVRSRTPVIPGIEMKMSNQFVPDKSYQDRDLDEQKTIRSEGRAEKRTIESEKRAYGRVIETEHREILQKETESITDMMSHLNLAVRGNIDTDELDKTKEGRIAKYVLQSRKEKGLFGSYPPLQNRYIAEQLKNVWPNSEIIFEPQGKYDWDINLNPLKGFGFSTWINKDHYFPTSGENVRVIQNAKTMEIPTADPNFNTEILIDYNNDPPVFRSKKDGRYFPEEMQNLNAPPAERLKKIVEHYKNYSPDPEEVRNWRYVNPPDLIDWGKTSKAIQAMTTPARLIKLESLYKEYNGTTDKDERVKILMKIDEIEDDITKPVKPKNSVTKKIVR